MAHIVIRCKHFEQTLDWHKTVLVAKEVFVNDFIAFVTYDDEHHRIALVNIGVEADDIGIGAGVDHVAFCLENVAALMNHYSRLTEAGIEPVWSITGIFNMVTNSPNTREFEGEASYNIG